MKNLHYFHIPTGTEWKLAGGTSSRYILSKVDSPNIKLDVSKDDVLGQFILK